MAQGEYDAWFPSTRLTAKIVFRAPPRGTQETAGALGEGPVVATAISNSFTLLTYAL